MGKDNKKKLNMSEAKQSMETKEQYTIILDDGSKYDCGRTIWYINTNKVEKI